MHVDEQLSDSVMRRRNERIAEPRNEEVREELAHQEFPEEPYRRDPAKKVYQISDMTEDGPQVLKTTRSAAEMYQYVSGLKDEYVNDPQYKALKWDAEMERGYILAFGEEEQDGAVEHKHVFNLRKYPESEVEHIEKDGSLEKDEDIYDYNEKSMNHEMEVRAYPESEIDEVDDEGIIRPKENSPYLDRPDLDMQRAYSGTVAVEARCDDDDRIEDVSMQERFSTEFVKAVKKERPESDIQKFREISISPDGETVDYSLNDIVKKGFLMADQQLEQPKKSQNRAAQAER